MEIVKIVAFSLVTLFLFLYFKETKQNIAALISLVSGVIILLFLLNPLTEVINFLREISTKANVDTFYVTLVLKIVGITYLASFAMEVCNEAGANGIASRIEVAAKILIMVIAMPILMGVLDAILKIM
jgi:stage III sporulation protein AD